MVRYITGGVDARVIMTGVGSSAVQAWPKVTGRTEQTTFATASELNELSFSQFDARTGVGSKLAPAGATAGRLTPQANLEPTYQHLLWDQTADGAVMSIETVLSSSLKTLALPSILILAATKSTSPEFVGVEFGSNGVRVVSYLGTTLRFEATTLRALLPGNLLRVERFLNTVRIYVNGLLIATENHPTLSMAGSPGVGLFSSPAPNVSSSIGQTTIQAFSSSLRTFGGQAYLEKLQVPQNSWTNVATVFVKGGKSMRSIMNMCRWTTTTVFSTRQFQIMLNGTQVGVLGDQNGTDLTISAPFDVPENSRIDLNARSDANPQDRIIRGGWFVIS